MKLLFFLLGLILFSPSVYANKFSIGDTIKGANIYVYDGDTIKINNIYKIRLEGIDCPEKNQLCLNSMGNEYKCGKTSTKHLKDLIKSTPLKCEYKGKDIYKRILAICYNNENKNINAKMVESGFAIAREFDGKVMFKKEQQKAKKNKSGLWQGKFTVPHQWRMKYGRTDKYKI